MFYDPFDYEIQADPYPTYRQLRDEAPIYHNPDIGFWALTRYRDVLDATLDWQTYSSAGGITIEGETAAPMIITMDPPTHTLMRNVVSRSFTPRAIGRLEGRMREIACQHLDALADRTSFDIVQDFSARFPIDVISELFGIPEADRPEVQRQSNLIFHREANQPERPEVSFQGEAWMNDYFAKTIADRRARPREDMLTELVQAEVEDRKRGGKRPLSDDEILGFCILLSSAGHETVTKMIANCAVALTRFPDQRALLAEDPGLATNAAEELLRYDPPSHYQGRMTTRDVEIHGERIPKDSRVLLVTGAAVRDEREYPDPDRVDLHRKIDLPLAFGYGHHICLGKSVARLELKIALEEIYARWPDCEVDLDSLQWAYSSNVRGLAHATVHVA